MAKNQAQTARTQQKEQLPISYEVRIHSLQLNGPTRATASVDINGGFAIRGVKVMEGSKGLFVRMPSYKANNGEYRDICFPCTKEGRELFSRAVLGAYEAALKQTQGQRNAPTIPQQAQGSPAMSQSM